jgi:hypothetical protein
MHHEPTKLIKVAADLVPYGRDVATGPRIWAAFDGDRLVAIGNTRKEASCAYRRKFTAWREEQRQARTRGG